MIVSAKMKISVLTGALLFLITTTFAHIRLTYPPARNYDLDFLDNARTPYPCGMPYRSKVQRVNGTNNI